MSIKEISRTLRQLPAIASLARALKPRPMTTRDCLSARVEKLALEHPERSAVIFEGRELNWSELNAEANRFAHTLKQLGLGRGDCAALMMENRIEFLTTLIALNKLGAIAALINTNLNGRALAHCLQITDARWCLFGEERMDVIDAVRPDSGGIEQWLFVSDSGDLPCPAWAHDLGAASAAAATGNPEETQSNTIREKALYIFTSGTTGLPKAAVMTNRRFILSSLMSSLGGLRCDVNDRIYLCLPLYHGTALFLGAGAAFNSGASLFLRRKFSASHFLDEVREHQTTCFIYIGEICRYLLATPAREDDYRNPLSTVMGNGLRPDIWQAFKTRFGITRVSEFYGSSEGNMGFINLLNKDCTVGTGSLPHTLVQYDIDADEVVRDKRGRCIKVKRGEPGLLLGKITAVTEFEGYTNAEATEKKILRDVYKTGDAWFNTGDLLKTVDVGFAFGLPHYQFVDRIGDTFRWKGENVSTNEVGEVINAHPQVHFCNVYGVEVPGTDGRAGMAALLLEGDSRELDLESFSALIVDQLPAYARPLFLRILPNMDTTGTFKMVKGTLRKEGFDPAKVSDPIMVMKPGSARYEPLSPDLAADILAGKGGY
ncbi:long-chain-acyl-CoA synthetase [Pseudohalioglobus sediminis]|uniref:Long-chain-acyl-CoA synthetase n=1 Tax=Pseudohalioglobus sediminis TaxID=2606449 RepID=A0A5B0X1D2_9GAMM|nr:long-chain-acyl-CoA synthetase [Pseudohalioglobus sediminis]KAA1192475.1 long-chain-acyl-CoA synthetase [Pseudohalioglobus sediminis]